MGNLRIKTIKELESWNNENLFKSIKIRDNEKPIVLEWFLDWFFDEALIKDLKLAKRGFDALVEFTVICESLDRDLAVGRVLSNLNYWFNRASKTCYKQFSKFKQIYL